MNITARITKKRAEALEEFLSRKGTTVTAWLTEFLNTHADGIIEAREGNDFIIVDKQRAGASPGYRALAVVEVEKGVTEVKMISDRARGVVKVHEVWHCYRGTTDRCNYYDAETEAKELIHKLRGGRKS